MLLSPESYPPSTGVGAQAYFWPGSSIAQRRLTLPLLEAAAVELFCSNGLRVGASGVRAGVAAGVALAHLVRTPSIRRAVLAIVLAAIAATTRLVTVPGVSTFALRWSASTGPHLHWEVRDPNNRRRRVLLSFLVAKVVSEAVFD